ncbi:MAG: hypothetical protein EOP83_12715 [Verrucomicrobiaceae bacterium]|nr:MAG: hypothetical protein EOP83_12715 [Verrucomicrobiaceae bacterium]
MSKKTKAPKAPVSPEQAVYDAANATYQEMWRRADKLRDRYRKAERAYLALPVETWDPRNLIRYFFGRHNPVMVEFYAAKEMLDHANARTAVYLGQREAAYKRLVAWQKG